MADKSAADSFIRGKLSTSKRSGFKVDAGAVGEGRRGGSEALLSGSFPIAKLVNNTR